MNKDAHAAFMTESTLASILLFRIRTESVTIDNFVKCYVADDSDRKTARGSNVSIE